MSNSGEVFAGGATTSQHVDAQDDDHFENTTFKLKRTRSLGLLDEFILPTTEAHPTEESPTDDRSNYTVESSEPVSAESVDPVSVQSLDPVSGDTVASSVPTESLVTAQTNMSPTESEESEVSNSDALFKSPDLLPHDDTDLATEPSQHVDYLSHQWDVSDISKSWRYVISKRKDVANSARLENASWRTWAQRRSNLKTISPEVVNWSKDSDVTWLYGPILRDDDGWEQDEKSANLTTTDSHHHGPSTATSAVAGDISIPNKSCLTAPKPILKRRTVEDMMISHSNLLKLQLATNKLYQQQREKQLLMQQQQREKEAHTQHDKTPEFDDYYAISAKLNSQYKQGTSSQSSSIVNLQNLLNKQNSTTNLASVKDSLKSESSSKSVANQPTINDTKAGNTANEEATPNASLDNPITIADGIADIPDALVPESDLMTPKEERHIHFNDEVQQCIALNVYVDDDEYDDDDEDDYYDDEEVEEYYYQDSNESEDSYVYDSSSGQNHGYGQASIYSSDQDGDEDGEDDDDEDEDEDGGFFLKVKSLNTPLNAIIPGLGTSAISKEGELDDSASISTTSSKVYKTIEMLPSTNLNYGSSDEESDDENPYTSSLSHNVNNNSSRGYDYYYDYNTVYTVDPNHAIYGNCKKEPDVVDVPENITMGSSFDYDAIDEDYNQPTSGINTTTSIGGSANPQQQANTVHIQPIQQQSPFHLGDDSDDDSSDDSDTGLSIKTRTSLQSLAQQVFINSGMTATDDSTLNNLNHPQPVSAPVSSINPNHSSTSISKQPHSSNSLSDQFFGGPSTGMSKKSSSSLSSQFFNQQPTDSPPQSVSSSSFFTASPDTSLQNPAPTQRKASPLPPHTTSTNAFLGNSTPPLAERKVDEQPLKKAFTFDFDSDSDSEDEFIENAYPTESPSSTHVSDPIEFSPGISNNQKPSYTALSQVAGKNGITSPSPELVPVSNSPSQITDDLNSTGNTSKIVGQAKGLANHFLGGWKHNNE
jgi:hypothetical protein